MKKLSFNSEDDLLIPSLTLVLLGFAARMLPHPANFAPIGAIAIFGGLYLPRRLAIVLPLVAMLASDFLIGFYSFPIMLSVYGSFALAAAIGLAVRDRKSFPTVISGTLAGSIVFFLITNAAVWAFGTMYTHDFTGLIQSYTMAIPFFRNSVLGDLFYTGALVGNMEWVSAYSTALRLRKREKRFATRTA